ncbi:YqkE family protein [Paenibacillus aceti]|nr:YqkE family protein [Paenibacillus aceti]
MAKRKAQPRPAASAQDKPATLKDLLNEETLSKLKAQATELKRVEEQRKEEERIQAEETKRAERKKLENDFEYLLNKSNMDWQKYK